LFEAGSEKVIISRFTAFYIDAAFLPQLSLRNGTPERENPVLPENRGTNYKTYKSDYRLYTPLWQCGGAKHCYSTLVFGEHLRFTYPAGDVTIVHMNAYVFRNITQKLRLTIADSLFFDV